jgi:flagellar basal body-associated protein FliL
MTHAGQAGARRTFDQAPARMIIVALVFFLIGAAVSALWFTRKPSPKAPSQTDLSHTLARSTNGSPQPPPAPPPDLAALDAVKRYIPDLNSASLEEGTRILREAALAEFQQTARELQARQTKAEQNFIQGQNNQSDAQQQMATKELQQLRAEQVEKLKKIAAKSQAQIETLQQLKETTP